MILPRAPATGGRKAPRHEIASGDSAPAVPQASGATKCYGDLGTRRDAEDMRFATGMRLDREYNLDVTARILLNGDFTFCPIYDFKELGVAKKRA
jgi:hypothetical protein